MSTNASTDRHSGLSGSHAPEVSDGDGLAGLVSLNPADGLFLRAEHLSTIQDYARGLSMAVGQAAGAGVVWGLDLRIDEKDRQLVAAPGLAVSGLGRPLLSRVTVRVDLPKEAAGQDQATGYWVVRACYDDELTGRENRYGNLCDDECGCDGGSTIRPFRHEGLRLDLLPQSEAGLGDQDPERRRGWLASWYFEQERRLAEPWLTRGTESQSVGSRLDREWYRGGPEPTTACVPLGVLLQVRDRFVLDTWTARRDIGQGHADDVWRWRLGMRPWNVFTAQILQFQDQLSEFVGDLAQPVVAKQAVVDSRAEFIEQYLADQSHREEVRKLAEQWASLTQPFSRVDATTSLYDKGFTELPPAGFLPAPSSRAALERGLEALLDGWVSWRVCSTSADAVARAVDDAQHLDRIPLTAAKDRPEVDILVPDRAPDLHALATSYGWVAFVRRRQVVCEARADEVEVYTVDVSDLFARGLVVPGGGRRPPDLLRWVADRELERIGGLTYPRDTWEFPGGDVAAGLGEECLRVFGIVAVPREESRAPLMALRAQLFAASFIRQLVHVGVAAGQDKGLPPPECLILLLGPAPGERTPEEEEPDEEVEVVEETSTPAAPPAVVATTKSPATKSAATKAAATKGTASKATALKAPARKAPVKKAPATPKRTTGPGLDQA